MSDFFQELTEAPYFTVLAMGLTAGLILGYFMAQASNNRKKVYGGVPAQIFHYLAASGISAVIPTALIGVASGLHILRLISLGLLLMVSTWLCLFVYGFFEGQADITEVKPARELD